MRLSGVSEAINQQIAKYDSSEFDDDKEVSVSPKDDSYFRSNTWTLWGNITKFGAEVPGLFSRMPMLVFCSRTKF